MEQTTPRHQRCNGVGLSLDIEMELRIVSFNVMDQAFFVILDAQILQLLFPCVSRDLCRAPLLESEISKRSPFLLGCQIRSLLTEENARG